MVCLGAVPGISPALYGEGDKRTVDAPLFLHPALSPDRQVLDRLWNRGFADANPRKRLDERFLNFFRRRASIRQRLSVNESGSCWLELKGPDLAAYLGGLFSRKYHWTGSQVSQEKAHLYDGLNRRRTKLVLFGRLLILPAFDDFAFVKKPASADQLTGVQVVLHVGKQIYQPNAQPGDLPFKPGVPFKRNENDRAQFDADRRRLFSWGNKPILDQNAEVDDMWAEKGEGLAEFSGEATPSESRATTNHYTPFTGYSWHQAGPARESYGGLNKRRETIQYAREFWEGYIGTFTVVFDLFNEDGTARVRRSDKTLEVLVSYGKQICRMSYDLNAWDRLNHH